MRLGAERLLSGEVDDRRLRGTRLAVVTHAAAVTADLRPTIDGLLAAGYTPTAVVTPEHGFTGCGPPGSAEVPGMEIDFGAGIRVVDGYDRSPAELADDLADVEVLLVDLSDLGTRCSTYLTLLDDILAVASLLAAAVVILDRPNPLGRAVAGPALDPALRSHVGRLIAPLRHGLTIGEAARALAAAELDVEVIAVTGWDPAAVRADRPWVAPAPNLPTADAALCYAGTVLLEGVVGAEPRGTTSPFQLLGADWIDHGVVDAVRDLGLPGLAFRATTMAPLWGPRTGEVLPGIAFHVTDATAADPLRATVELLCAALAAGHELSFTRHFDLICGRRDLARRLLDRWSAERICAGWETDPGRDGGGSTGLSDAARRSR